MDKEKVKTFFEEIKVLGNEPVDKVKALIHEGNVRRIIIKDDHGHTFVEIPVSVAAVGAVFAPVLAAVGAIAAMAAKFTIVVEKAQTEKADPEKSDGEKVHAADPQ
jgi:hypothetical protein